jgi:sugar phosphate isomerase/epimerase
MRIGLCTSSLANPALIAASGLDFVEENVQSFLAPEGPDASFVNRLGLAKSCAKPILAANCFLPADLKCVGKTVDRLRLLAYADQAFARARRAGIGLVVFGSGNARQVPEGFDRGAAEKQFCHLLADLGPRAARHGVTVVVEPLHRGECNFINTVAQGASLVRWVNHPSIRLLADLYHMMREQESPAMLIDHGELIRHVHLAERNERTAPGVKGDNFRPYFKALQAIGYDRTISLECGWTDLATQLERAVDEVRRQLADASQTDP